MTFELTGHRIRRAARLALSAAAMVLLTAGPAAAGASMTSAPPTAARSGSSALDAAGLVVPLAAHSAADDGRRSFGVQPAGPKKPDPRPNFTYRDVKPGQTLYDHVAFVNVSDKPVTLTVYAADGYNTGAGAFDLLQQKQRSKDVGSWVRLRRDKATVPARSALVTPIAVTIPKNAEPGDHAGGIVASLKTLAKDRKGNTVTVDERVGTRIYIRVAGALTPRIELDRRNAAYHPGSNPFVRGDADVTYTIKNTGNVRLVGTQTIRVSDVFGSSTQAVSVPEMPELLPGYSFTFTTKVKKVLPTLLLTAHVTLDPRSVTGNVDPALQQASASARFWAIYWPAVVLLLLAVGEGLRRWWLHRRRRAAGPASGGRDGTGPSGSGGTDGGDAQASTPASRPKDGALTTRTTTGRKTVRTGLVGLIGVIAVAGMALTGAPAQAAGSSSGLTFIPAKGEDISPMYVVTPAPCPAAATNIIGRIFGKGFPADGIVVLPNSDAGVRHDAAFGAALQNTIQAFASDAKITLAGKYTIKVQCVNDLATKVFAEFSGVLTFGDATHYTAPAPKVPPAEGVPVGFLALVFPEYKPGSPPSAAPGKTPSGASGSAAPAAAQSASQTGKPASSAITSSLKPFLIIILGAAVLGGVGFLGTRPRPSSRAGSATAPKESAPPTEWPDDDEHLVSSSASTKAQPDEAPVPSKPEEST